MADYLRRVQEQFPEAKKGFLVTGKVLHVLTEKGLSNENTLFGVSTCPDEINRAVTQFGNYFGKTFNLGGLAGIPFTGMTGFGAYSHHPSEGGTLFILYASHVGINIEGDLGSCNRVGQSHHSSSCGSAVGAYNTLLNDAEYQHEEPFDLQQTYVVNLVRNHLGKIKGAENPMKELAEVVYQDAKKRIEQVIAGYDGPIVLLGGIQINTPNGSPDYFAVRDFREVNPKQGTETSLVDKL